MNDASFKSGTVLIEDGYAYFKFDKFYDKLRSKNWKYSDRDWETCIVHGFWSIYFCM